MPKHDYTFGCQNEQGEFDVFANIRDEQASDNKSTIILKSTTQAVAEQIIAIMVERGLLEEKEVDGKTIHVLTEKAWQIGQEHKPQQLEETHG